VTTQTQQTRRTQAQPQAPDYAAAMPEDQQRHARVREIASDRRYAEAKRLYQEQRFTELCPPGQCLGLTASGVACLGTMLDDCPRRVRDQREQRARMLANTQVPARAAQSQWDRVPEAFREKLEAYVRNLRGNVSRGRGVLMVGGPGCGKTSALGIIAREAVEAGLAQCLYVSSGIKLLDGIMAWQVRGQNEDTFTMYRYMPLLLVDDFDRAFQVTGKGPDSTALARLDAFSDERYSDGLATCVAMNASSEQLAGVRELTRTVDRWRECMVTMGSNASSQRTEATG
jgi:DNA replication protein DnaC